MRTSPQFQKVSSVFFIVMGLLSFVLVGVILSIPSLFSEAAPNVKWFFVLILSMYGVYRIYTGVSRLKKSKQNQQV